ncbi:WSSV156 [White spot syndrome virus]|uniref:WSSV156 n=1 Tax=White spot syndrome virus TaxID=342409 RepID=A0A2I6SBR9_9VIRU|nr:WSSV156 [White spot syndrome virus]
MNKSHQKPYFVWQSGLGMNIPKFRLSVWKNWKPFTSAPIIVQNVGYSSDVFWHETLRSKIVDRSRDHRNKSDKENWEDWANKNKL